LAFQPGTGRGIVVVKENFEVSGIRASTPRVGLCHPLALSKAASVALFIGKLMCVDEIQGSG
jgi:hypothetical protein